ncbi:MAG: redoxin family protein [Sphingomicrobium sp.]
MSKPWRFIPLILLGLVVAGLVWRLSTPADTSVGSKLAGQSVPAFALDPAIAGKPGLASSGLVTGAPHLVNNFASWCVPCRTEAGVLRELKARGVTIEGIAIRDRPGDVARFLARYGDPYDRIGSDPQSAVQIALGSSGVPESFIVDGRGIIRYQHIGPIEAGEVGRILERMEEAK